MQLPIAKTITLTTSRTEADRNAIPQDLWPEPAGLLLGRLDRRRPPHRRCRRLRGGPGGGAAGRRYSAHLRMASVDRPGPHHWRLMRFAEVAPPKSGANVGQRRLRIADASPTHYRLDFAVNHGTIRVAGTKSTQTRLIGGADALGSGPSPVHPGWRFESSLRHSTLQWVKTFETAGLAGVKEAGFSESASDGAVLSEHPAFFFSCRAFPRSKRPPAEPRRFCSPWSVGLSRFAE